MPTMRSTDRVPRLARWLPIAAITLLVAAAPAAAQTPDMKQAERAYREGASSYGAGLSAREKGDAEAARAGFATAAARLAEAQRLLHRDLYRYRYAEALSLRALGRLDAAWPILSAIAEQGDEPEIAGQARATIDEILGALDKEGHGLIELDCALGSVDVRVAHLGDGAAKADAATPSPAPLDRWIPCPAWATPQMLPPGRYEVQLRSAVPAGVVVEPVRLAVELVPGARKQVLVHYALAPTPPVYIQGGGCGGGGFQQVRPTSAPAARAVVDHL